MVLGAAQGLDPFAGICSAAIDVFGDGGRSYKADGLDVGVVQNGIDRQFVAMHDVQHTFWQTRFVQQLANEIGRRGIAFGRFQDKGVAAGDGHREHPHRHHAWKVERCDPGDDAQRLSLGVRIDRLADIAAEFALQKVRDAAGELDNFQRPGDFAQRVIMRLAVLSADLAGDVVSTGIENLDILEKDARALGWWRRAPRRKRGFR